MNSRTNSTRRTAFFAVATESFFARPAALEVAEPALYKELAAFYRQDPIRWSGEAPASEGDVLQSRASGPSARRTTA